MSKKTNGTVNLPFLYVSKQKGEFFVLATEYPQNPIEAGEGAYCQNVTRIEQKQWTGMKDSKSIRLVLFLLFICIFPLAQNCVLAQESIESDLYIKRYEDYLNSLKSISFDFRNVAPSSSYGGTIKFNGDYCYRFVSDEDNPHFKFESICSREGFLEISFENGLTLFGYLDNSNIENYSMDDFLDVSALVGYTNINPPLSTRYIPNLLREFQPKSSLERSNGADLILLSGTRGAVSIKAWLDPTQNYLLKSLEIKQADASKSGDTTTMMFSFDKFIDVSGVRVPTFHEYFHSMVSVKDGIQGIYEGRISTVISNIKIAENTSPAPYSFQTRIPNGTRAILFDAQQIEHIWYDGKIVPKTNELMMQIAMGDHKFMPGPDEPRFWLLMLSFLLIALGLGKMIYNIIYKKEAGT